MMILGIILQTSKEDLLQADFEGALKFFRVQLPKRYRAEENARRLMEQACNIKVRYMDLYIIKTEFECRKNMANYIKPFLYTCWILTMFKVMLCMN